MGGDMVLVFLLIMYQTYTTTLSLIKPTHSTMLYLSSFIPHIRLSPFTPQIFLPQTSPTTAPLPNLVDPVLSFPSLMDYNRYISYLNRRNGFNGKNSFR